MEKRERLTTRAHRRSAQLVQSTVATAPCSARRYGAAATLHSYKTLTGRRQRHPQPWVREPPTT